MSHPTVGPWSWLCLLLLLSITGTDEHISDYSDVLSENINFLPYVRIELRDGVPSDADNGYIRFFLRQTICPIMVATYTPRELIYRSNFHESFAVVTDMESFNETVNHLARPGEHFFFIVTDAINLTVVETVFRSLWSSRGIFRTLLLTVDGIMFYHPVMFDEDTRKYGSVLPLRSNAISHVFDDLNGYPLRVQIFKSVYARPVLDHETGKIIDVQGADAYVAKALQKKMNFTMILQKPAKHFFGERSPNGTFNGAIGMIIHGETDISLTGFFVKDYLAPEIEFSVAVYDDQLCCYVPKAARIPQSILPIFAVSYDFWLTFILTAFACGTIWMIMRRINLWIAADEISKLHVNKHLRSQFIRIYIDTWVVWVRVNVVSYPPFNSERIFILSICLVSVIFGAIIESSLATVYIHPMYYKDINTLHELDDSNLNIIYKYTSFKDDLFFSETSQLFAALNKKLKHLKNLEADVIKEIAETGGIASVTRYSSLMLESIRYILTRKVHIVKECPKYYTIAYVMPRDSPIKKRVNNLLLRFTSAGLIEKWIKDMYNEANLLVMKTQAIEVSACFKVLTLVDLQLAFYVIVLGTTLSSISFLVELYVKNKRRSSDITIFAPYEYSE